MVALHSVQESVVRQAIDTTRPPAFENRSQQLVKAAREGYSPGLLVRRYMSTATGSGRLSFVDFMKLRLFEPRYDDRALLRSFVGERRALELCAKANYRADWFGTMTNKVAERSYLAAFGLPTLDIQAIYLPDFSDSQHCLGTADDIRRFLTRDAKYPIFGKPLEGYQSLGSMGLLDYDPETRELAMFDGRSVALDDLVDTIVANYASGYIFQPFASPHPAVRMMCGNRLSTVRFLTLQTPKGPVIARAVVKIPGGSNAADNFWREGNLLAQVDAETGRLGRVMSGSGLDMTELTEHPQTGHSLVDWIYPDWTAMRALALAGAHVMRNVPIIGWDIADTSNGPTIVEMNATPDMLLFQLADRRGMFDEQFDDFLAYQGRRGREYRRFLKAEFRKVK